MSPTQHTDMDIQNKPLDPLKLYEAEIEQDPLVAFLLSEANGCPYGALRLACAVIETIRKGMSSGMLRLPPIESPRPPKPQPPAL